MEQAVRPKQRGGVVSFIIIGLVVIGLFVGAVYFVKQRSNTIASVESPATQQGETSGEDEDSTATDQEENAPQPGAETDQTEGTPAPAEGQGGTASPNPAEISATGPADTLVNMLILGLLAGATTSFVQSRKRSLQQ